MKKKLSFFAFVILCSLSLIAQKDTTQFEEKIKKGWNLSGVPAISYDSDLGYQYGVILNLYHYGDGSRYPNYNHSIYTEFSRFSKGNGIHRIFYDSDKLLNGIRLSIDLSYITATAQPFYGFNGYEAVYNTNWTIKESDEYKTRFFYGFERDFFRLRSDIQNSIQNSNFGWLSGFACYRYFISSIDYENLNNGKSGKDSLPEIDGLYENYLAWNIIPKAEQEGGWVNYLKLGLKYDTRDNYPNPTRGIWTELIAQPALRTTGNLYNHLKLALIHRQYFTIFPNRLTFAYRIGYQKTFGKQPFYTQQLLLNSYMTAATSEGIGGSKSARGILRNRITGQDFTYWNFEFRWKFYRAVLFNQNIYLAINSFLDGGMVTKDFEYDHSAIPDELRDLYFSNKPEKPHISTGLGFRIAINQNFIIATDFGKALDMQDGKTGFYVTLNYLF